MLALVVKNPSASVGNVRDMSRSLGWEDPLEEGMATHSSYSCLENSMDRGACQALLSMEFSRQEWQEWDAISFSRRSSQPKD